MFAVSPVAPSTVAASPSQQVNTPERVASVTASSCPVPAALDPRSTYALSTQTADAVLSLVNASAPARDMSAPFLRGSEAGQFGNGRNAELPLLAGDLAATIGANQSVAAVSQGQDGGVDAADPNAAAAESKAIRRVEEAARWDAYLYGIAHTDGSLMSAISFYLLCNDAHYRDFKTEHPSVNVHWINVDNKKIVSVWPRITDPWFPQR
jgi:hypothetical protein